MSMYDSQNTYNPSGTNCDPENTHLVVDPSAVTGNIYLIQLDENSTILPSSQTIHQVLINDYQGSENIQCLIPTLASNVIEGQTDSQLILTKLENCVPSTGCKTNQIYIQPQCHNVNESTLLNGQNMNLVTNFIDRSNSSMTIENVGPSTGMDRTQVYIHAQLQSEASRLIKGHSINSNANISNNYLPRLTDNVASSTNCMERSHIYIQPQAGDAKDSMILKRQNINSQKNQHPNVIIENVTTVIGRNQVYIQPPVWDVSKSSLQSKGKNINSQYHRSVAIENLAQPTGIEENESYIYLQPQTVNDRIISKQQSINLNTNIDNQIQTTIPPLISNYVHIPDRAAPPRAVATLPPCLRMRRDCIYPRYRLAAKVRFGPVRGIIGTINKAAEADHLVAAASAAHTPVFLMKRDPDSVVHVDVADKDKSNWLSLLPLGDDSSANVWLYEEGGELYGITNKVVLPRTPLTLGYSKIYFDEHKLPNGMPVMNLTEDVTTAAETGENNWRCMECDTMLGSETLLHKHLYKHRMCKSTQPKRAKCRCSHCKRIFFNKFSLTRHIRHGTCIMASHTNKEFFRSPKITKNTKRVEKAPRNRTEQCPTPIEENRLSDESLQNYTNGLDISTNLFDPDRMPNLDTSGSDFNPFPLLPLGIREVSLANCNDAGYAKFSSDLLNKCNDRISKDKTKIEDKVLCPYCKQSVLKSKNRHHFRNCSARRVQCECGKTFYKKESLSKHIQARHSDKVTVNPEIKTTKEENENHSNETPYQCEECQVTFKRRGMLVNHMWREHEQKISVPVQRSVRLYTCPICPKVYRTAAKRKRHMIAQHPGAGMEGARSIGICVMKCQASACPACPRQYATRAKLYQHVRREHPHLAPPKKLHGAQKRENTTANQQESGTPIKQTNCILPQ